MGVLLKEKFLRYALLVKKTTIVKTDTTVVTADEKLAANGIIMSAT